ncbi:hypothetical protein RvY_16879 [Ramazzottius varieornatus]|uniref:Signal recognition particle subunit SRP72 n=1 Tax=Ramazzottius varieornatus TaxID=947166 RepID=A0A1D1W038_RAMVA|nr:hypothetical protein RvY_16879 [Ramazzottius varieornatus]
MTDVSQHFEDLVRHHNNEDFDKALKSVNTILKEIPTDQKALHCKTVCLVQLSKFTEALEVAKKVTDQNSVLLLVTYSLYRLNRYPEIIERLSQYNANDLPLDLKELKAQTLYKLEKYADSVDLYKDLLKKQRDDLDTERQSNFLAALTQLHATTGKGYASVGNFAPSAAETYELMFNAAAWEVTKGNFDEAGKKLRTAQALFQEYAADEELSPQKVKNELVTIKSLLMTILLEKQNRETHTERLTGFNVESIENNFLNQFTKLKKKPRKELVEADAASPRAKPTGSKSAEAVAAKKKRKKRKPRLPKNYDPNVKPDPERWLPKYERSNYKKKKDKRGGGGNVFKGAQGSTSGPDTQVTAGFSSGAGSSTPKAQHVPEAAPGPRQQKPQAAAKKQAKKKRK